MIIFYDMQEVSEEECLGDAMVVQVTVVSVVKDMEVTAVKVLVVDTVVDMVHHIDMFFSDMA
jgi:hypothetical protein